MFCITEKVELTEKGLQEPDHDTHTGAFEARVVLEISEDEAGGLLVVIAGKNGDGNYEKRQDVEHDSECGNVVQETREEDIDERCDDGQQVCDQDAVPAFYRVIWVVEVGHTEEEVRSNLPCRSKYRCQCLTIWRIFRQQGAEAYEVRRGAHGHHTRAHEPTRHPGCPSCVFRRCQYCNPRWQQSRSVSSLPTSTATIV